MSCFLPRQDIGERKTLKRINTCEIEGMILSKRFTSKPWGDTKGDFRGKERGTSFFPSRGAHKDRELEDDRRMKDEDKWREKEIAHLFLFLCIMQLDHQSIISSAFISFIKKFMQQAIINHTVDLIWCQFWNYELWVALNFGPALFPVFQWEYL